jgi:tetratricopeptide (TPR) repeat protein
MILGPLIVFTCVELVLRLVDYGYPTSFFLRTTINGREFYVPNPKFTFRFFSATQARPTLPIRIAAEKPKGTYRIFLFGESAANGDPDPTYGVARYLEVLLRERFPKIDFEVLNVAITGINSHTILPIARECARHHGDLWLIYMGNNEMVGPFGAETVFGTQAPSLPVARATLAIKTTRFGQLLDSFAGMLKDRSPSPESWGGMQIGMHANPSQKSWGGMQMFMENRLQHDAPARLRVYRNFEGNLEDILAAGHRAGVPVILSTVAVNLKDCPPFASLHKRRLDEDAEASWNSVYDDGVARQNAGAYKEALALYEKAGAIDPDYADLQFRMGQCHLALTNDEQAGRDFELARDYDALAFRTDTALNQTIKNAATRHADRGVYLVDAAEVFAQKSPERIPGLNLFYEHVHLNFEGNYFLALSFAEQAKKLLPESITARDKGQWATAELCDRRLAATVWDRQRVWKPIFTRISAPPFTGQLGHDVFVKMSEARLDEAKAQMSRQTPQQAQQVYEEALAQAPEDYILCMNFEQFLEAGGYLEQALVESKRVCELAPNLSGSWFYTGTLLARQGRAREAEEYFTRAVSLRNDYPEAWNELGLVYVGQQKNEQAATCFNRALKANPAFADAYVNLGFLEQLRQRTPEAIPYYDKAAALQPEGAVDYFDRGVKLAVSGRSNEAIGCFANLVRQVPAFWQAHYRLGVELAKAGSNIQAQAQFMQVLRYRPDYAQLLPRAQGAENKTYNATLQGQPAR